MQHFAIDDAYRFFESQSVWDKKGVWFWYYLLPGDAFLKGLLHTVTDSNIFGMRMAHIAFNFAGIFFLYKSCLLLGVTRWLALAVCISLLSMPLFFVVSMSFYAESLLAPFFCFAIYCYLSKQNRRFLLIAALLPFIHLQGIFLVMPFWIYLLVNKRLADFFILVLPGIVYVVLISLYYGNPLLFFSVQQLYKLYPATFVPMQERGWGAAFVTLNPFFVGAALIGGLRQLRSEKWPIFVGPLLLFLMVILPLTYLNGYEPRYLFACLPPFFLFAATALEVIREWVSEHINNVTAACLVGLLLAATTFENFAQSDPVRARYFAGQRWPVGQLSEGVSVFFGIKSHNTRHGTDMARRIENFLTWNPEIRLLVVNNHNLFYYLDRNNMPDSVKVVYSPYPAHRVYEAFQGKFFGMTPDDVSRFYRFSREKDGAGEPALFVGDYSFKDWPAAYANMQYSVYELEYQIVAPPEKLTTLEGSAAAGNRKRYYWGKNLCEDAIGYYCPDWGIWKKR